MTHISYSELKNWDFCPFYHKLVYIDKLKPFRGNEYTAFGTAIHEHGLVFAILDTIVHAFLPTDMFLFLITWVAISISLVVGPAMAMRIHGGRLKSGEFAPRLISWILPLSSKFGRTQVDDLANSGLADALHRRLYFDELYDWAIGKTVIPFAYALSWFDKNVIDGAIKGIEWGSQKISGDVIDSKIR